MSLVLESFGTVWTEIVGVLRNVHFEGFTVMFVFGEGCPLLEGIPTCRTLVLRSTVDFHVTVEIFRCVKALTTGWTNFVLIF